MARITITLRQNECEALAALAERERRPARDQAALIIRRELQQLGLMLDDASAPTALPIQPSRPGVS